MSEADNGADGIKQVHAVSPDVVVLDVMMPVMDGWQVLGVLKRDPRTTELPVVMATFVDDAKRGLAMGAAEYLSKPISRDTLLEAVGNQLVEGDSEDERG